MMAWEPNEETLRTIIAALLSRHTTGRSRFTVDELQQAASRELSFDFESPDDVWAYIDRPYIVDSPLKTQGKTWVARR